MLFKFVTLFILCFSIAACGGGSSSSKKKNLAPFVNAGADLQIQETTSVNLSAQASDDGTVVSVLWTQLSGANVTLSASDSKATSFTAPLVSVITEFRFRFTATDDQGVSSSDLVKITVTPVIDNPVVSAGEDQTVDENTLVTLTASATDNHGIASQIWTQVSGPTVSIDNSDSLIGSFTPVVATDTTFAFKITAVDNRGNSSEDTIKIHVNSNNEAPIVDAGIDQQVQELVSVSLSSQATDDGTVVSVQWTQLSGANVTLSSSDSKATSFTAPLVSVITEFSFRFTATDNLGVSSSDLVTITVTPLIDNPVVSAGEDQTVDENTLVTLSATASDTHGIASQVWTQVSGPTVFIDNSDSLIGSFTPIVATDTTFTFKITAVDNRENSSEDTIKIHVNTTNLAPTANAGLDQIVTSGNNVILNADTSSDSDGSISSYSWQAISGASGITLSASNTAQVNFDAPFTTTNTAAVFQLTVTDNRGAMSQDEVSITIEPGTGTITGAIKYENVPHTASNGLNYANSSLDPVRGADVELLDSTTLATTPVVLASTTTNHLGEYSFNNIPSGQSAIVRVKSTYVKAPATGEASWDMQVIDNTNSNAIYALDSSAFVVAPSTNIKNLTALSGWSLSDNDYTTPRAAAPFHILDRAYDMVIKIVTADADVIMPPAKLNWSIKNAPAGGDKTKGLIGTSHYTNGNLYILGLKDSDTDEYDGHVILHELGHYFEDKLSRADSIGGSHSGGDRLDMRVAFGEGFGNAWSGMISDDSVYRDSNGSNQSRGFHIDVENNAITNSGWYSEGSVQSILYDMYDSTNEAGDSVSLGFSPIYNVLIGAQKITPALTSIFSFGTEIKSENASASADIDTLLVAQGIVGSTMDIYGSTESNNAGGSAHVLPVYTQASLNIATPERCSINTYSTYNKLSVSRFFRFTAPSTGSYTITATSSAGSLVTEDPDIFLYKQGVLTDRFEAVGTSETGTTSLSAGDYVFSIVHYPNYGNKTGQGTACFTVTITQN